MKREYFYEGEKAEQRGFWFLAVPLIALILIGGYFLTKDQPHEHDIHHDVHKEYERQRNIYYHSTGNVNSIKHKDTIIVWNFPPTRYINQ